VADASEEGWFFTGRRAAIAVVSQHLTGGPQAPLLVCGARGTGKSALLGWSLLTGHPDLRRRLPLRVWHSRSTVPVGTVHAAVRVDDEPESVAGAIAEQLGLEPPHTVAA
jgi:hypothetical protein